MDNKLSKPVAYTDADELRFHHATSDMWPVPLGFGKDEPLYSQEYVSALLARIAALEEQSKQLKKELHNEGAANAYAYERIRKLEKRLATPVRLSCETHPRCRTQHAKDVRAAGFKVTGDA